MASSIQNPVEKQPKSDGSQRARVVQPDTNMIYHIGVPKEAVASIGVVDVDVVVKLASGETVVLAEAGLAAMTNSNVQIEYTNTRAGLTDLINQSGLADIPAQSDLAQNVPAFSAKTITLNVDEKTNSETPDPGGNNGVGMSSVSTTIKIDKLIEKVLQAPKITAPVILADLKKPEIIPQASSSPASSKASKEEELIGSESNVLQAGFYSDSSTSIANGIFYGGYGVKGAETNSSISIAMQTTPVVGFSNGMEVKANPLNGASFQKTLRLVYSGVTAPETITISNLPSQSSIVGAQRNADGSYVLKASDYAQNGSSKIYDIPLQYQLYQTDSSNPVHDNYTLKIDLAGTIGTTTLHNILNVAVKVVDGSSTADLETYQKGSSSSVMVLSAQGANYEFTALGNNTITGGANADTMHSTGGHNVLNGGAGINTISYDIATSSVRVDLSTGNAATSISSDSISNFQKVIGSSYNDSLRAGQTTLSMDGGAGGNDTFDPNGAGTQANPLQIKGSVSGINTLDLTSSPGGLEINAAKGSVSGVYGNVSFSNIGIVLATQFNDTIIGPNSGSMTIDGGGGSDLITGGTGSLTLTYANATQGVTVDLRDGYSTGYGNGRSTLSGNIENITGSAYSDVLTGNKIYTRVLDGGAGGNDTFDPGGGGTSVNPVVVIGSSTGVNILTLAKDTSGFGVVADLSKGMVTGGYPVFLNLLQISSVHIYLTYPFVLSWSLLEAMSAGCAIVGSATPPVLEVMTHEENGLLVDFFSPEEVLAAIERVLDHPDRMADMRARARQFAVEHYDLQRICLPAHLDLIHRVATAKTMKDLDLLA